MTQLRDEMGTWSPDKEVVFLAEVSAGYRLSHGAKEFWVAVNNNPCTSRVMLNHARLPCASPHIKASAS